jgi:hypothetical protein
MSVEGEECAAWKERWRCAKETQRTGLLLLQLVWTKREIKTTYPKRASGTSQSNRVVFQVAAMAVTEVYGKSGVDLCRSFATIE